MVCKCLMKDNLRRFRWAAVGNPSYCLYSAESRPSDMVLLESAAVIRLLFTFLVLFLA